MLCRADPDHPQQALTNRLISRYIPFDFLTRFEFNRPNFNRDKEGWSPSYREFVENVIEYTYLNNRPKQFESLFGLEGHDKEVSE